VVEAVLEENTVSGKHFYYVFIQEP